MPVFGNNSARTFCRVQLRNKNPTKPNHSPQKNTQNKSRQFLVWNQLILRESSRDGVGESPPLPAGKGSEATSALGCVCAAKRSDVQRYKASLGGTTAR